MTDVSFTDAASANGVALAVDGLLDTLVTLRDAYPGFEWESARWARERSARSPYRALGLFGLSPRTKDRLLISTCTQFFDRFPNAGALAALGPGSERQVTSIVRKGQVPFVLSMAKALQERPGVPDAKDELMKIRGVGEKVAECVLAYGWGRPALPLDANVQRVLERVAGRTEQSRPARAGDWRETVKSYYRDHQEGFVQQSIAMVDIHEILRLHGQLCCTKVPDCSACPLAGCRSRREPGSGATVTVSPGFWDGWRGLLLE